MFDSDNKRALIAVVLSGFVLFGWQYFYSSKFPQATVQSAPKASVVSSPAQDAQPTNASSATVSVPATEIVSQSLDFSNDISRFSLNNSFAFNMFENKNQVMNSHDFNEVPNIFELQIKRNGAYEKLIANFQQLNANSYSFTNSDLGISGELTLLADGKLNLKFSSQNESNLRVIFHSKEKKLDTGHIREFLLYSSDLKKINVGSNKDGDGVYKWFGVDFNYHLFAFVLKDKLAAKFQTSESGDLVVEFVSGVKSFEAYFIYSKKVYDSLISVGDNLDKSVDFGMFSIIAVPIFRALQFIYRYLPNYGIAIILLTILIRLITFPLQYKSFKGMKKMQELQPEMQKIKEKYKNDQQKMQQETMELFKKAGANPLSGCLPLLLQMPFFFAIYRVLFSSVELVGAPFYGWIKDLSIHDPFYVLPVLMAVTMFLQQKMTPSASADPIQQKVMMFMPLIFAFIFKGMPAGLVLYIVVSTFVGILQQYFVYKLAD